MSLGPQYAPLGARGGPLSPLSRGCCEPKPHSFLTSAQHPEVRAPHQMHKSLLPPKINCGSPTSHQAPQNESPYPTPAPFDFRRPSPGSRNRHCSCPGSLAGGSAEGRGGEQPRRRMQLQGQRGFLSPGTPGAGPCSQSPHPAVVKVPRGEAGLWTPSAWHQAGAGDP